MLERPEEGTPAVRPSDAERDKTVTALKRHCADGHLTLDEFSDRISVVLQARTRGDLVKAVSDLPAIDTTVASAQGEVRDTTWVVGVMSGGVRKGRWRPGRRIKSFAFWGGCHIDLRGAEFPGPVLEISAFAMMGGIEIVVPEGVKVEIHGVPIMGGIDRRVRDVPTLPGTPTVIVKAFAFWGGVCIRSKPSRSNEERLRRQERRHRHPRHDNRRDNLEQVAVAVQQERPDLTADTVPDNTLPDGTVTILFSDIEDFTSLTERLGDLRAQEVLRGHNEIVRAQVAACGGHEVKSQGDSFMVSFAGARRGVRCAIGIQRAFVAWSEKHPEHPLRVRIGLHTGEAIREADDLFGRSVIMAARIAAEAEGGVILVSSLLKELAESSGEFSFGPPRTTVLKGLNGEHVLYPVVWEEDDEALPQ